MPAKTIIGLPVISDGHQQRLGAVARFTGHPGSVVQVILVEDGAVAVERGRRRRLDPSVLLVLPPGWTGSASVPRGAFVYRLDLDGGPDLAALVGPRVLLLQGDGVGPWRGDLVALAQRWWRSLEERRRVAIQAAALVSRLVDAALQPEDAPQGLDARFHALVREHIGSGERAAGLARRLGVSRITLDRRLRRSTGVSAADWLRRERLRAAAELLVGWQFPVAEVACRCGFADGDSFTRAFRRLHGCTPREWRRRHRR